MGGQQSTRRITVVSDEAGGVIKISDSVVNRLKEEIEGSGGNQQQKQDQQANVPLPPPNPVEVSPLSTSESPPAPPAVEMAKPQPTMPSSPEEVNPPIQQNVQPVESPAVQEVRPQRPVIQYIEEPSLSSLKIRAEKEKELNDLDNHWKKRVQAIEQETTFISNLQTASIALSVKELEDLMDYKPVVPICQDQRNFITECLQQNQGQPLKCGDYVKEFSNCVNSARLSFVGRAG